jgi:hypothetical protein
MINHPFVLWTRSEYMYQYDFLILRFHVFCQTILKDDLVIEALFIALANIPRRFRNMASDEDVRRNLVYDSNTE